MSKSLYSKITSKGQITIPSKIREELHLTTGSKLEFINKGDHIIILPLNKSVQSLKGVLPKPENPSSLQNTDLTT